jgi:hypothetical protein
MIVDHLQRAAIEIHYALADLSAEQDSDEQHKTLVSMLRFALAELEWVSKRVESARTRDGASADRDDAAPPSDACPG